MYILITTCKQISNIIKFEFNFKFKFSNSIQATIILSSNLDLDMIELFEFKVD